MLRDNYLQSQAISLLQTTAVERLGEHAHFIRSLELEGLLDRQLEYLPSSEEIEDRRRAGQSLVRPELALLLSYAKISLNAQLIQSDVPEDPYLGQELHRYFPERLVKRYGNLLGEHRLKREIIVTATTNSIVNRMGPTFVARTQQDTGADAAAVARAYSIARESFDARETWRAIEALDNKVAADVQYAMVHDTVGMLRQATYWLIQRHRKALSIEQQVARLHPGIRDLARAPLQWLQGTDRAGFETRASELAKAGVPAELTRRVAACLAIALRARHRRTGAGTQADGRGRRARLFRHRGALRPRLAALAHRSARHRRPLACGRARQPARGVVRSASQPGVGCLRGFARDRPGQGRGEMAGVAQGSGCARARGRQRHSLADDRRRLRVAVGGVAGRAPRHRRGGARHHEHR